ncbi:MAG: hypothetical protein H6641_15730 [Caldilineaceae bacterium]|nr:hypothetical protein [Caldilineaceae bacterium]
MDEQKILRVGELESIGGVPTDIIPAKILMPGFDAAYQRVQANLTNLARVLVLQATGGIRTGVRLGGSAIAVPSTAMDTTIYSFNVPNTGSTPELMFRDLDRMEKEHPKLEKILATWLEERRPKCKPGPKPLSECETMELLESFWKTGLTQKKYCELNLVSRYQLQKSVKWYRENFGDA